MVLVVGATGLVGSQVCLRLRRRGEAVRALVRPNSSKETVEALRLDGVELCVGDLKDLPSLVAACDGVNGVIATASSTLNRQPGDSIETVDSAGYLNLVSAATDAGVERFVFVSFRKSSRLPFPLAQAKQQVEDAIAKFNFTVVQASLFMEVWLSPALGFDYLNGAVRIYGPGTNPISWVSARDVAEFCSIVLRHPLAERKIIEFGGPEALSPLEVVAHFGKICGKRFQVEHVPEPALRAQFEGATDPLQKSFAALMLQYLYGDAMDMGSIVDTFGIKLTSVNDYASSVLSKAASA